MTDDDSQTETATAEPLRLTQREAECLRLLAGGSRMHDLAMHLGLAEKTVEKHVVSARKRLGATTRDHAVAIAIREGLI